MEIRVVLVSIVSLNPGDAAILQGTMEILRRAFGDEVSLHVFDRDGDVAGRYYPWAPFRRALFPPHRPGRLARFVTRLGYRHRLVQWDFSRFALAGWLMKTPIRVLARSIITREESESIRRYLEADFVIASGGTYLVPEYNMQVPIYEYRLIQWLGKPLVFFPQSMGPFKGNRFESQLKKVFNRAAKVFLRDLRSAHHLKEIGVDPEKTFVASDAAFALAIESDRGNSLPPEGIKRIAISVREWRHFESNHPEEEYQRYLETIAAGVIHLRKVHDCHVVFLSSCQGIPEYWADDSHVAETIRALVEKETGETVEVDRSFRQPRALMEDLAEFDAVIATRMHVAILALCAGVPVLSIAYQFKTRELFEGMGFGDWVVDIDGLEAEDFKACIDRFLAQAHEGITTMRDAVSQQSIRAFGISDVLRGIPRS